MTLALMHISYSLPPISLQERYAVLFINVAPSLSKYVQYGPSCMLNSSVCSAMLSRLLCNPIPSTVHNFTCPTLDLIMGISGRMPPDIAFLFCILPLIDRQFKVGVPDGVLPFKIFQL